MDFVVRRPFHFFEVPAPCLAKGDKISEEIICFSSLFDLGDRCSPFLIRTLEKYGNQFFINVEENKNLWFCIKFVLPY